MVILFRLCLVIGIRFRVLLSWMGFLKGSNDDEKESFDFYEFNQQDWDSADSVLSLEYPSTRVSSLKVEDFDPKHVPVLENNAYEEIPLHQKSSLGSPPKPLDQSVATGDTVIGGTLNENRILHVKATKVGSESALSQIVRLVESAQMAKAHVQKFVDRP
ncbi:hypothetical protein RYX36_035917 [Vicia faba]